MSVARAAKTKQEGAQTELAEQAVEVVQVKQKMKPRGGNSPVIGQNGYKLEPGDNTKFTMIGLELMRMEPIDLHSLDEVNQRLDDYFMLMGERDVKPTVAGMAMALGVSRQSLWAISRGVPTGGDGYKTALPAEVADSIKKAYHMMELMWEEYMVHGKINPVTGIFLAKNNFGYQDKQEMILTPNTSDTVQSPQELERRYLDALPDGNE